MWLFGTKETQVESLTAVAWKRLKKNPGAIIGLWVIGLLLFLAVFAPIISPMNPTTTILEYALKPSFFTGNVIYKINPVRVNEPSIIAIESYSIKGDSVEYVDLLGRRMAIHISMLWGKSEKDWHGTPFFILGTDNFGRDVLSRILDGTRVALLVGVLSVGISLAIGILIGAFAGYYRGWVDEILSWFINVMWSFPTVLLVIALSVVMGNGLWQTCLAIGVSGWVEIARIVRGQFFSLREVEYVEATRSFGFHPLRVIFRHILPNALGPIIVVATAGVATSIILEASLSFLGLGIQPPDASWGRMIQDGRGYLYVGEGLGLVLYPCVALAVTVYSFNLFGDGLRDALDPKTSQR